MPKKMVKWALAAPAVAGLSLLGSSPAMAAWTLNLRQGVTELSREIYGLHMHTIKVMPVCTPPISHQTAITIMKMTGHF